MGINSGNLSYSESVQSHYFVSELYNNILDKLKTIGVDSKYYKPIKSLTFIFSILIPFGFIFIAVFHNIMH